MSKVCQRSTKFTYLNEKGSSIVTYGIKVMLTYEQFHSKQFLIFSTGFSHYLNSNGCSVTPPMNSTI